MKFISLKGNSPEISFAGAIMQGLAPDGGLYFPSVIPKLTDVEIKELIGADRQSVAFKMLNPYVSDEMTSQELEAVIKVASNFETPIRAVGDRKVLELFHGPTLAFKDVGARYLAGFMAHFSSIQNKTATVLVATSGDTGGGIAQAFSGVENINVVILFPKGRVSALQYEQLTRSTDNIYSLEIDGSFDDCQDFVKRAFNDQALSELNLTSANSINLGRLLPQTTYHGVIDSQLDQPNIRTVVPTGNLGNLTAGLLAMRMGIPVSHFVAANNKNDAVHRYLETGKYEPNVSHNTMSNAMDVGAPNNLPRVQAIFDNDIDQIRSAVSSAVVSDDQTIETIKSVYEKYDYLLDPHTAVAWNASEQLEDSHYQDLIVATASPLKFAEEIEAATGIKVDNSQELNKLRQFPSRIFQMSVDYVTFKQYLMDELK
ncbi:threonine synthase [Candidatus Saccharibacteria bacterium]|jgi:threonine synthase|nr:threonine synthase [Candidatus Saccharibacteria bacterium]MBP9131815.1 threonine synthase [Candidatus Saccharibacteria bacterium]